MVLDSDRELSELSIRHKLCYGGVIRDPKYNARYVGVLAATSKVTYERPPGLVRLDAFYFDQTFAEPFMAEAGKRYVLVFDYAKGRFYRSVVED